MRAITALVLGVWIGAVNGCGGGGNGDGAPMTADDVRWIDPDQSYTGAELIEPQEPAWFAACMVVDEDGERRAMVSTCLYSEIDAEDVAMDQWMQLDQESAAQLDCAGCGCEAVAADECLSRTDDGE